MIVVTGHVLLAAGEIDRMKDDLTTQMAASQAEDGCDQYVFSRGLADPNVLFVAERWRDKDAMDAHMVSDHQNEFRTVIGSAKILSAHVVAYEVSDSRTVLGGS